MRCCMACCRVSGCACLCACVCLLCLCVLVCDVLRVLYGRVLFFVFVCVWVRPVFYAFVCFVCGSACGVV